MPATRFLLLVALAIAAAAVAPPAGAAPDGAMEGMAMAPAKGSARTPATAESVKAMANMHKTMMAPYSGDADADFASHMLPHHRGAVDMAEIELKYGKDPEMRALAESVVAAQKAEIDRMNAWLAKRKTGASQ